MAQIRLKTNECVRGYLPLVCVRCGQLAAESKPFPFSRIPIWMYLAFFFCGVPCVLSAITIHLAILSTSLIWIGAVFLTRRRVTVDLPVCRRHRRFIGMRTVLLGFLVPAIIVLIFAVVGLPFLLTRRGQIPNGFGFCILPVVLFILLGLAAVVNRIGLRVSAISESGVTLKGVHAHFADVVHELRDAKYDEQE